MRGMDRHTAARRLRAAVRLLHPLRVAMWGALAALGGVLAAGWRVWASPAAGELTTAALSAAFFAAAAHGLDAAVRAKARSEGADAGEADISARAARGVAGACAAAGLALSLRLTAAHFMMAAVAAVLLYAYVAYLRRLRPIGPLLVATVGAMALVFGGAATGVPGPATLGAVYVFLLAFALVALDDREMRPLTTAALALAVALAPLPYLFLGYGGLFLLLMFFAAGLLLSAVRKLHAPEAGVVPPADLVKAALVAGLAAFSFAGVTG
ncbi:hypothetical protein [Rhodocaloribacter sp.]